MKRLFYRLIIFTLFAITPAYKPIHATSVCPTAEQTPLDLTIDGVILQGCLPFYPDSQWVQPDPTSPVQSAYTEDTGYSFSITVIPFGSKSPAEIFPVIDSSSSINDLMAVLQKYRQAQGAKTQSGPTAILFGGKVAGLISLQNLPGINPTGQTSRITEWLAIAGKRLWIIRAVQAQVADHADLSLTSELELKSDNLNSPSGVSRIRHSSQKYQDNPAQPAFATPTPSPFNLPNPSWWSGACDINHYQGDSYMNPYRIASYALGSSYRNVLTCGPLPGWWNPDVMIYFYESAFPVYEFQCVELVLRFMYQAYGVAPYMANGNGIVSNYSGTSLIKIANHTTGKAPQPGDILSYCPGCTYGHTSVVISSIVDSSGNGSIDVMEQNWTANGQTNLKVSNWTVIGDAGWVYAWLHPVYLNVILPTPTPTPTQTRNPYPTLESTMTLSITPTPGSPTGNPVHIYFPFTFNTGN